MTAQTTRMPAISVLNADVRRLPSGSLAPIRRAIRRVGDPYPGVRRCRLTQSWLTDAEMRAALHHGSMTPPTWRVGALW